MEEIIMRPIGIIRSPYKTRQEAPRQSLMDLDATGTIELFADFADGARDIVPGSWGLLLFQFHLSGGAYELVTVSRRDNRRKGVFSTRSPFRPNHIGVSTVRFTAVDNGTLKFQGVDVLDGTPLLDIKPYEPGP